MALGTATDRYELRFDAGRICLDLLSTTHPGERLYSVEPLRAWITGSGLVPPGTPLAHADGSWLAKVPVVPGTNLLRATAVDARHNEGAETRAVVIGPTVPLDGAVTTGIRATCPAASGSGSRCNSCSGRASHRSRSVSTSRRAEWIAATARGSRPS